MKREGMHHAKLKLLARDLDQSLNYVRGLLVTLWNAAAISFPRGDIGRLTNEEIAITAEHEGDAELLVASLIKRRLLDEIPESDGRLYIHDWHDHADDFVQLRVGRDAENDGTFASGVRSKRWEKCKKDRDELIRSGNARRKPATPGSAEICQATPGNASQRLVASVSAVPVPVPVPEPVPSLTDTSAADAAVPAGDDKPSKLPNEEALDALIDAFNALPEGFAPRVAARRSEPIVKGWAAAQRKPDLLAVLLDAPRLVEAIRGSPGLDRRLNDLKFFDFAWLFGKGQGAGAQFNAVKIIQGNYRGDARPKQRSLAGGSGQNFDADRDRPAGGVEQW